MTDIRKRVGRKGVTYQVRFRTANGHEYRTFDTLKEARAFREDSKARRRGGRAHSDIKTVSQAVDKWLEVCKKEGRNGREPITKYTHENYEYRADIIKAYDWTKKLNELGRSD